MDALVQRESRQVDLDELRQILRQARHLDLRAHVRHDAALGLHAGRNRLALEVQRNGDADLLVLLDALKVDVHDGILERMPLHVLQDRSLRLAAHLETQDRRVEALVVEHDRELLMAQGQRPRLQMSAIQNCRHFALATQAAARTFAMRLAELRRELKRGFHSHLQLHSPTSVPDRDQFRNTHHQSTLLQSTYSELTESSSLIRRIVSASKPDTVSWRMRLQPRASSDNGIVSVTTSSSSTDFEMRSMAVPESTGCVM